MSGATIIVGSGDSPLRPATPGTVRDWALAIERGVVQGDTSLTADPERWISVLDAPPPDAMLNADPAVVTYEHVPGDSPALLAWRAGRNPLRSRPDFEGSHWICTRRARSCARWKTQYPWLALAGRLARVSL